jgi:hypothetical protein
LDSVATMTLQLGQEVVVLDSSVVQGTCTYPVCAAWVPMDGEGVVLVGGAQRLKRDYT